MLVKIRSRVVAVALPVLALAGCVSATFRPSSEYDASRFTPVASENVRVLTALPASPFVSLGEIEVNPSGHHGDEAILKRARIKAASIGADAIVYVSAGTRSDADRETLHLQDRTVVIWFTAIRTLPKS